MYFIYMYYIYIYKFIYSIYSALGLVSLEKAKQWSNTSQESQNHRISPMRRWSAQLKRKVCTSLSPFNHQMKQTRILQMGRLRPRKGCRMLSHRAT